MIMHLQCVFKALLCKCKGDFVTLYCGVKELLEYSHAMRNNQCFVYVKYKRADQTAHQILRFISRLSTTYNVLK